jgi:hypothetical protein
VEETTTEAVLLTDGELGLLEERTVVRVLSAINRPIVAEEDVQSKGVILFQSGFLLGR